METINSFKGHDGWTFLLLSVPDVMLKTVGDVLEELKQDYLSGSGEGGIEEGGDFPSEVEVQKNTKEQAIGAIRAANREGKKAFPSMEQAVRDEFGEGLGDYLIGSGLSIDGFKLIERAFNEVLVKGDDGKWKKIHNEKFDLEWRDLLLSAAHPGQAKHKEKLTPFSTPEEIYQEIITLSLQGKELSFPQLNLINKTIPGAADKLFRGRKGGERGAAMNLFLSNASKTRQKPDRSGYEDNPDYNKAFVDYATPLCKGK